MESSYGVNGAFQRVMTHIMPVVVLLGVGLAHTLS